MFILVLLVFKLLYMIHYIYTHTCKKIQKIQKIQIFFILFKNGNYLFLTRAPMMNFLFPFATPRYCFRRDK